MNRRTFLQWLGLVAPVAAVAPKLLLMVPEAEVVQTITSPWIHHPVQDIPFPKNVPAAGVYKYVKVAHPESIHAGDTLMFTDKAQMHVIPVLGKVLKNPPPAMAISSLQPGQYGWVQVLS